MNGNVTADVRVLAMWDDDDDDGFTVNVILLLATTMTLVTPHSELLTSSDNALYRNK